MAKAFCIPKHVAEQLKQAVKNKEWDMKSLWEMESKQRHEIFEKYVDSATALRMNAAFEAAMISDQQNALMKWAEKVFVGEDPKTKAKKKDVIDKIKDLNEIGYIKASINEKGEIIADVGSEIFLSDLVEEQMGVTLTDSEMKKITELTKEMEEFEFERNEYGLPTLEYWEKRRNLENYIKSLVPSSKLKIATSLIGRASMLFSPKTAILNVESNLVFGTLQKIEKRIARILTGRNINTSREVNEYMSGYRKYAMEVMSKYNYDVTRITDLKSEMKTLGEEKEVHSQGEGTIRKIGRFYEDVVFSKLLSVPDVAFSAYAFSDTIGLWAVEKAKSEGLNGKEINLRALEIAKDATKIEPETEVGQDVRTLAIADAQHATFTNDTTYSSVGLKIRDVLNTASGDLRLGDFLMPFVKTPANVVGVSLDAFGLGALKGIYMLPQAITDIKTGDYTKMDKAIRNIVSTGLGWTLAYILSSIFKPEDFVGLFPTSKKEREMLRYKNATANSVLINGKWTSIDYFGSISTPLLGFLYARKYKGGNIAEQIFESTKGLKVSLSNFPGVQEFSDILSLIEDNKHSPETFKNDLAQWVVENTRARIIPAIVSDIAKMTDRYERETYDKLDPLTKVKAAIPGVRSSLPIKKDVYGEEMKTEAAWSVLLFGSRLKTLKRGELIDEVVRLDREGNAPSITNSEYTSSRVKNMKQWLSKDRYKEMISKYQKEWVDKSIQAIRSRDYSKLPDEEKAKVLTTIKQNVLNDILDRYNYARLKKEHSIK